MQLIGMLDSPYVRRVAISLQLLGLRFEHQSVSVFRGFTQFAKINPVVKAPTLVCDDGTVLMDSTLIIDYAETLAGKSLLPATPPERLQALRITGLALAACEKSIQIVYERMLRPREKLHEPWVLRVTGQLLAACDELEAAISKNPPAATSAGLSQAGLTTAVAWFFIQSMTPEIVAADRYPALCRLSATAEELPAFKAAPHGEGICRAATD
jgi:glutathione S-transferase